MIETIFGSEAAFLDWSGFIFGILGVLPVVFGFGGWVLWKTRRRYDVLGAEFEDLDQRYARYRNARQKEIEALKANLEKVKMLELRLDQTDPERFIDRANELYDAGDFDGAEKVSLEFTSKQSEAFGLAAEILAEQRLLDSETEGQWAADDAQKFAAIGRAANPESKRLEELEKLTKARVDGIARNEPIEALHMDGMSDVELSRLANTLSKQGRYQLALIAAKRSVPLAKTRTGGLSYNYAAALGNYAYCLKDVGDLNIAQELSREALLIAEKAIGKTHPSYAIRLNNLAGVLEAQGQYVEAEALYREALAVTAKSVGKTHPSYAIRLNNLAGVLNAQGQYVEAEALYREALAIDAATIGKSHPSYASDLNNLAGVLEAQGQYVEAEALCREALAITADIQDGKNGTSHPDYAIHLNNLANVLEAQGDYAEAEALLREALAIVEERLGKDHPNYKAGSGNLEGLLAKMAN